jgi:hypothetical protein
MQLTTRIDEVSVARISGLMLRTVIAHSHRSHMLTGSTTGTEHGRISNRASSSLG